MYRKSLDDRSAVAKSLPKLLECLLVDHFGRDVAKTKPKVNTVIRQGNVLPIMDVQEAPGLLPESPLGNYDGLFFINRKTTESSEVPEDIEDIHQSTSRAAGGGKVISEPIWSDTILTGEPHQQRLLMSIRRTYSCAFLSSCE